MIAYDKNRLDNLMICEQGKRFARLGLISESELAAIAVTKQPAYHRTNIFIRTGILLLTLILAFCSYGLVFLFFGLDTSWGFKIALLFFALITFAVLEFFIVKKQHFSSGVDDGLLYFGLMCFFFFLGFIIDPSTPSAWLLFYILIFTPSLLSAVRYADCLAAVMSYVNFVLIFFYATLLLGDISMLIMPFVIMIISLSAYLFVARQIQKYELRFWQDILKVLYWSSLLSFYVAGNYFVVREASVQFFNMEIKPGEDIPLSMFFYAFTILVPLVYIYLGIRKKDAAFLNCGLIVVVAAIATIRYYHSIIPIELALMLGGFALLATAWLVFRFLKTPRNGFSVEPDKGDADWFGKDVEAIIIAEALAQQPQSPIKDTTEFGAGKFGGGGAGADY